jgi:endonuclease YncB( thermonuclease family)
MKKILTLMLLVTGLFAFPATVVKIIDGDTITVKTIDGNITKLRFADIDTPEKYLVSNKAKYDIKTCGKSTYTMGKEASAYLESVVKIGNIVEVKLSGNTSYDRDVAIIYFNNTNLNELMVLQGYAYVWHTGNDITDLSYKTILLNSQTSAKENKLGLWKKYPDVMECLINYHK